MPRAIALLSGGLDSRLAVCILKEQGIEIEAVNFQTMFSCCRDDARQVAHELGIGFTAIKADEEYVRIIREPKYGYGRGLNPCVDCRIYMFERARSLMDHLRASFIITGEVIGQRPMSQKIADFVKIERDTGLEGLIVRPLSAQLLPATLPEKEGVIDRSRLYAIQGRWRAPLLALARRYGIENPPDASPGCALTQVPFADKVRDVFTHDEGNEPWKYEILKVGRHFRLKEGAKVVLGRSEEQNAYLEALHPAGTALLVPHNFAGPVGLLIGAAESPALEQAAALILRYAQKPLPENCDLKLTRGGEVKILSSSAAADESFIEGVRIR